MDTSLLLARLNSATTLEETAPLLNDYLRSSLNRYETDTSQGEDIAYEIAGLMSTTLLSTAPDDNPYVVILKIAGQLELPRLHRSSDASWEKMATLIRALP